MKNRLIDYFVCYILAVVVLIVDRSRCWMASVTEVGLLRPLNHWGPYESITEMQIPSPYSRYSIQVITYHRLSML